MPRIDWSKEWKRKRPVTYVKHYHCIYVLQSILNWLRFNQVDQLICVFWGYCKCYRLHSHVVWVGRVSTVRAAWRPLDTSHRQTWAQWNWSVSRVSTLCPLSQPGHCACALRPGSLQSAAILHMVPTWHWSQSCHHIVTVECCLCPTPQHRRDKTYLCFKVTWNLCSHPPRLGSGTNPVKMIIPVDHLAMSNTSVYGCVS